MSFYGQMRWTESTLGNWFYGIKLSADLFNASNLFNTRPDEGEETITLSTPKYLYPHEDLAKLTINRGNHWLGIAPIDCVGDNHVSCSGLTIFHNAPRVDDLDDDSYQSVLLPVTNPSGTVNPLKAGDYIKISSPKFDKAGHWAGKEYLDEIFYKLPSQLIQVIHPDGKSEDLKLNDYDKFEFHHDNWINLTLDQYKTSMSFTHSTYLTQDTNTQRGMIKYIPPEGLSPTVHETIQQGDYFTVFSAEVDKAGHVTKLNEYTYQLVPSTRDEEMDVVINWHSNFIKDAAQTPATLKELQEAILNAENNFKSATKDVQNLREVVGLPASKNENDAAPMKIFTDFKKELAALTGENDINNETLLEAIITYATWMKENQLAGHFARIKNLETNMKKLDSTFEVQVS